MKPDSQPEVLLSDLCAIWYKCPRCSALTCSLACVKRHKLWSQCSGVRDPAAYRKRTELATPSSVDQDYNFITGVERVLHRADSDTLGRGLDSPAAQPPTHPPKGQARLRVEIERRRAIVRHAPAGLSRSKQNKSHWHPKHKCLVWTIEWILPDGHKLLANSQELKSVKEAYFNAVGRNHLLPRKRKRHLHAPDASDNNSKDNHVVGKNGEEDSPSTAAHLAAVQTEEKPGNAPVLPEVGLHFYLDRPDMPSSQLKCLIPLLPGASITDVVRDRTILEFPTIYVRHEAAGELPGSLFLTEEDYLWKFGAAGAAAGSSAVDVSASDDPAATAAGASKEQELEVVVEQLPTTEINEEKILEVLQKDLASRG